MPTIWQDGGALPLVSVVVPAYNGANYIGNCIDSILHQNIEDIEVIVVDDCSDDGTCEVVGAYLERDSRVRLMSHKKNGGTLRSRRDGVLSSSGRWVLLVDQDDALVPGALEGVLAALEKYHNPDILHFGVCVNAFSPEAAIAAKGMESFLTPPARQLTGTSILQLQFSDSNGFDWHVHHKVYDGHLARRAWELSADTELTLSDDLYLSFIICSLAQSYVAVEGAPWYEYCLGRGETFGSEADISSIDRISRCDFRGLELVCEFAKSAHVLRDDWNDRVCDVADRLISHVMNELHDRLAPVHYSSAIDMVMSVWPPDLVAGELWRFVRDRAYTFSSTNMNPGPDDPLWELLRDACKVDALTSVVGSDRYKRMREKALGHLDEIGGPRVFWTIFWLRSRRLINRFHRY